MERFSSLVATVQASFKILCLLLHHTCEDAEDFSALPDLIDTHINIQFLTFKFEEKPLGPGRSSPIKRLFRFKLFPCAVVVPRKITRISQPFKGFQHLFGWIDEFVFA